MNIIRIILIIIIAVLVGFFVKTYFVGRIYIVSASMEPTLKINDKFWVNKLVYLIRTPKHGEIVVFKSPVEDIYEVKRVIAVAGDTIEIINKIVYINKTKLEEPYIQHTRGDELLEDDNFGPFVVPSDSMFVLGDNRDESKDSRNWRDLKTGNSLPFVPLENAEGKLVDKMD